MRCARGVTSRVGRDRFNLLMCLAPEDGKLWVGADTGHTNDPSEVTVWLEVQIIICVLLVVSLISRRDRRAEYV